MNNKEKGDIYEHFICSYLNEFEGNVAYLWKDTPEKWLYTAGLISDYNEHRLKRKQNEKVNPLQDVG